MNALFLRAVVAFLALPAVVAGLVPLWILGRARPVRPAGFAIVAVGVGLLLWCVREFYVAGKGTLAPWDPPRRLVTTGLYRFSRNPMYVAVLTILAGLSLVYASRALSIYAVGMVVAFHLRVVLYEEPTLARLFPAEWAELRARVPRWLGRSRPRDASAP